MEKTTKIVGLCGPSGSGKSTIAKLLAEQLNGVVVGLDNYFLLDTPYKKYDEQGKDLELPENTDWAAINALVDTIKTGETAQVQKVSWPEDKNHLEAFSYDDLVIIEGFLLLHDLTLISKLDLSVYLDISEEEGVARRVAREGSTKNKRWFEEVTFPEYREHRSVFSERADLVLDGTKPLEESVSIISAALKNL